MNGVDGKVVAVLGPTATGKSQLALSLAERFGGEIVSADSVQVYRGLDVGSAKTPPGERRGIAHHLIDTLRLPEQMTAADFAQRAQKCFRTIWARGRLPFLVGGSGLYMRAALGEWSPGGGPPDPAFRARLAGVPTEQLHRRLAGAWPERAGALSAADRPRIVRALELAGRREGAKVEGPGFRPRAVLKLAVNFERDELYRRIDARSAELFGPQLLAEALKIEESGAGVNHPARRALGYREALCFLGGLVTEGEAVRLMQRNTRRFAKRQLTWWRRDREIRWLTPDGARCEAESAVAAFLQGPAS